MTDSPCTLREVAFIQLVTYPEIAQQQLIEFQESCSSDNSISFGQLTATKKGNLQPQPDSVSLVIQYQLQQPIAESQLAEVLSDIRKQPQPPEESRWGETWFLLAQADAPSPEAIATGALQQLQHSNPRPLRGGPLRPGVELFVANNRQWIVLLTQPTEELEQQAAGYLYGPLRLIETLGHRIGWVLQEYKNSIRPELEDCQQQLQDELDKLIEHIDQAPLDPEERDLQRDHQGVTQTVGAYRRLNELVSRASKVETTLRANRLTLMGAHREFSEGPGQAAVTSRLDEANIAVGQIETDLGYCRPLLESARWTAESHQASLLAGLNFAEHRQKAAQENLNLLLTTLGIWVTVLTIWAPDLANSDGNLLSLAAWETMITTVPPALLIFVGLWWVVTLLWIAVRAIKRCLPDPRLWLGWGKESS